MKTTPLRRALILGAALTALFVPTAQAAEAPPSNQLDDLGAVASTDTSTKFATKFCGVPLQGKSGWYSNCTQFGWGVNRVGEFNFKANSFSSKSGWRTTAAGPFTYLYPNWYLRGQQIAVDDNKAWETYLWQGYDNDIKGNVFGWWIKSTQWRKTTYVTGQFNLSTGRFYK